MHLRALYVDKSGAPSRIEDLEELTTTGDAERRPITDAERKALSGNRSAGHRFAPNPRLRLRTVFW